MSFIVHPNGYGMTGVKPECQFGPYNVNCPCCKGEGCHEYGHGMDIDSVHCVYCDGTGEVEAVAA